jgi:uncharacterized protein YggE
MKATRITVIAVSAALLVSAAYIAGAAASNTYQVTGPILSMSDTTITVQKDSEQWEIARDKATPVKGGALKVGAKVTIKYRMTAVSVEVK